MTHDVRLRIQLASTADSAKELDHASLTRPLFFYRPAKKISGLACETRLVPCDSVMSCTLKGGGVGPAGRRDNIHSIILMVTLYQAPDSLMLASIEARMRRLGKLAHQTARQVAALKSAIQDGHQVEVKEVDYLRMKVSSPVMTKAEQNLPEWKFFNKEATSIFRNIRVVEKWLQGTYRGIPI